MVDSRCCSFILWVRRQRQDITFSNKPGDDHRDQIGAIAIIWGGIAAAKEQA